MEFVLDKLLKEIEEITNKKIIGGSWQRAIKKYKCGEFERTDDLIGEENILNEFFDQIDLDNFRRTINLLNKDLAKHRQRIALKIVKYLKENPGKKLFVVVSAGHLVGDDSLIKILAEQGFNLKQYSPSENPSEFIQNPPKFTKKEEENNEILLQTTTNKIPNIVFAAALQGNPPSFYENRSIREEKNRENEENKNLDENKLIELNNGEDGDLVLATTKIIPLIKNNMSEENKNNNFSTFISSNLHSKKSYFWIYFTSILSIILIILILCLYIYNKHSGYLKPPHLPFINDKTNCCQQQSSNISVAKGLPELKNNSQQQQIWSTTPTKKPTISSPQYSQQQQQNIFPLNTSPPKSATSFSEASNATGETSFNICENEGGGNIKNEEEEIKNNASFENKNENSSPLNPTITATPLVDGQYRSTSSLALSHTPKTQLNQSRMEINDKNQQIPQEPLKSPPFPPPLPSQQQHSTLPTIPESKRLAPPPPTDSVIKHKKLASLDENDEKIVENLDFNSPTNYFNNSKINEELLPSENQQQIYNNLNKNEYNGSNFNYPPLINNKEIQQSEIYLPEEDNQNSQQSSSSNSFPFTEVINNLNEEVLKNDEK